MSISYKIELVLAAVRI